MDAHKVMILEQKSCRKGSSGTKDHLLVNKLIMDNDKCSLYIWLKFIPGKFMILIWLLKCLNIYKIRTPKNLCTD